MADIIEWWHKGDPSVAKGWSDRDVGALQWSCNPTSQAIRSAIGSHSSHSVQKGCWPGPLVSVSSSRRSLAFAGLGADVLTAALAESSRAMLR